MRKIISSQAAGIGSYVIVFKKIANGSYELQGDMKEVEAKILQAIENAEQIYIGVLADDGSGLGTLESADIARGEEIQISSKSFACTLNEEGEIEIEDNPGGGGGLPAGEGDNYVLTSSMTYKCEGERDKITLESFAAANKLYINLSKVKDIDWPSVDEHGYDDDIFIHDEPYDNYSSIMWRSDDYAEGPVAYLYMYYENNGTQVEHKVFTNMTDKPQYYTDSDYAESDRDWPEFIPANTTLHTIEHEQGRRDWKFIDNSNMLEIDWFAIQNPDFEDAKYLSDVFDQYKDILSTSPFDCQPDQLKQKWHPVQSHERHEMVLVTYYQEGNFCDYTLDEMHKLMDNGIPLMVQDVSNDMLYTYLTLTSYCYKEFDSYPYFKFVNAADNNDYLEIDQNGCRRHYPEE